LWTCCSGSGVALVLDEFALILHLDNEYWSGKVRKVDRCRLPRCDVDRNARAGRTSVRSRQLTQGEETPRWAWIITVVVNGSLVPVTLLKGRIWMGVLGPLCPFSR